MSLALQIKERAIKVGFHLAGIAPIAAWKDLEFSRRWVEQGFGGEMKYLENPKRHDPRSLMPSALSVVCVGLIYNAPLPYSTEAGSGKSEVGSREKTSPIPDSDARHRPLATTHIHDEGPRAWISRYAWGRDYHQIMRAKLEKLRSGIAALAPGAETRAFVDTGPVVERAFARLSGIGWTGKNTCLINQHEGSWFFLGVVLTNLPLEPDLPAPDRCGSCTRCIEACPTNALVEPYVMNASRCIAYLNIELKGSIPEEFRTAIGKNVFGCDICQDVCPWNSRNQKPEARSQNGSGKPNAATTAADEFQPLEIQLHSATHAPGQRTTDHGQLTNNRFSLFNPPLEALAAMTEEDFKRVFQGSPIKRAKYRGWLRNLCVAMGNSGDACFIPRLRDLSAYPDPVVREHAAWALLQLETRQAASNPAP